MAVDKLGRRRFVLEHPAYANIVRAGELIMKAQSINEVPEAVRDILSNAYVHVRTATEVLMEPDALKQEMGKICLFLIESTRRGYEKDNVTNKMIEVADVTDEQLFVIAIRELHSLPSKFVNGRNGK